MTEEHLTVLWGQGACPLPFPKQEVKNASYPLGCWAEAPEQECAQSQANTRARWVAASGEQGPETLRGARSPSGHWFLCSVAVIHSPGH